MRDSEIMFSFPLFLCVSGGCSITPVAFIQIILQSGHSQEMDDDNYTYVMTDIGQLCCRDQE